MYRQRLPACSCTSRHPCRGLCLDSLQFHHAMDKSTKTETSKHTPRALFPVFHPHKQQPSHATPQQPPAFGIGHATEALKGGGWVGDMRCRVGTGPARLYCICQIIALTMHPTLPPLCRRGLPRGGVFLSLPALKDCIVINGFCARLSGRGTARVTAGCLEVHIFFFGNCNTIASVLYAPR
jgi:hypothetical protein